MSDHGYCVQVFHADASTNTSKRGSKRYITRFLGPSDCHILTAHAYVSPCSFGSPLFILNLNILLVASNWSQGVIIQFQRESGSMLGQHANVSIWEIQRSDIL